jgi:hypothetical protein
MNRKITPILLAVVAFLGLFAFLTQRNRQYDSTQDTVPRSARVLPMESSQFQQIRIQRDFWNSFALTRQGDGDWRLTEPSDEPVKQEAARRLAQQLADLTILTTVDLPTDDSERYREYGLWEPELQIAVTTLEEERNISIGSMTSDGRGYYCAVGGVDDVYTIPAEAMRVLAADLSSYRESPAQAGI